MRTGSDHPINRGEVGKGEPVCSRGKDVIGSAQGGVPDVEIPAHSASADGLAVATRSTRSDHPNPRRAANGNHTDTSLRRAIRRWTNSNAGLPT